MDYGIRQKTCRCFWQNLEVESGIFPIHLPAKTETIKNEAYETATYGIAITVRTSVP